MDTLTALVTSPRLVATGWTLAVILFETLALGVLFAMWRLLFPRSSASRQYAAGVAALSLAVALAAATPSVLPFFRALPSPATTPIVVTDAPTQAAPEAPAARSTESIVFSVDSAATLGISADMVAGTAGLVWLTGVVFLGLRLLGGALLAAWIRRRGTPVVNDDTLATAERLASELRLTQPIQLLQSIQVEAPVVIGWRRPTLVLPSGVLAHIAPEALVPLLAHEFAHIRRRDYLANLLQSIAELPLFFSPAALWISRRIREAREYCCDDAAVRRCADPRSYIDALMTLASLATVNPVRPVLGAAGPRLVVRVRRMVQGDSVPRLRQMQLIGLAVALVVLMSSGLRIAAISAARTGEAADAMPTVSAPAPISVAAAVPTPLSPTIATAPGATPPPITPAAPVPAAAVTQDAPAIPYGVGTRDGAGVELRRLRHTPEEPLQQVSVTNVTNELITGLRFVAVVERVPFGRSVEIVTSDLVPVQILPQNEIDLSNVVFPPSLRKATTSGERMQIFMSVQEVRFANNVTWQITPNLNANEHREALGFNKTELTREFLTREAATPAGAASDLCRDQDGKGYSRGAMVGIRNEPGRAAQCDAGRWKESSLR